MLVDPVVLDALIVLMELVAPLAQTIIMSLIRFANLARMDAFRIISKYFVENAKAFNVLIVFNNHHLLKNQSLL